MKLAVVGSRNLFVDDMGKYIPDEVTEIVSGGAKGVDTLAKEYAINKGLLYTEFLPEYEKYSRNAPLVRNRKIIEYANRVLAFWDEKSKGTKYVIDTCSKMKKEVTVIIIK